MKKKSSTNILAKIFKKNPKKNPKKKSITKATKKTKIKVAKKIIPIKKTKVKKKNKKNLHSVFPKSTAPKIQAKNDNLRISRNNEVKPEIKKLKNKKLKKKITKLKILLFTQNTELDKLLNLKKFKSVA